MRKVIRTSVLVLALTVSASAGEIQNPAPPPSSTTQSQIADRTGTDGYMQTGLSETVAQITLNVLQSVLTLL